MFAPRPLSLCVWGGNRGGESELSADTMNSEGNKGKKADWFIDNAYHSRVGQHFNNGDQRTWQDNSAYKGICYKPDILSYIPGFHLVEGKN